MASYLGVTVRDAPKYWLAFAASVPPLGFSTYTVSGVKGMSSFFEFTLKKHFTIFNWLSYFLLYLELLNAGAKLTRSSVYTSQGSKKINFDIGSENLKLTFSEENGKLTYHNKQRNLVC